MRSAPPPRHPASPAHRILGRPSHVARQLVAFRARPRVTDSALTATAQQPLLPSPRVQAAAAAAAAHGLRVRLRRSASAMDLFGDLPEPERSPAAGE